MADAADEAKDPVVSTPGDRARDGASADQQQLAGTAPAAGGSKPRKRPGRPKGSKTKRPDKPPATPPSESEAKELRALKKKLRAILGGPAAVLEPWPAAHVEEQAPGLADAIMEAAKDDPQLRKRLLAFFKGGTMANLIGAGVIYAMPVAIYYGAPAPALFRRVLSVPDRAQQLALEGHTAGPPMPPAPTGDEEIAALQAEAEAHGFTDRDEYMRATQEAVARAVESVRGPHLTARPDPPLPES